MTEKFASCFLGRKCFKYERPPVPIAIPYEHVLERQNYNSRNMRYVLDAAASKSLATSASHSLDVRRLARASRASGDRIPRSVLFRAFSVLALTASRF